MLPIYLDYAATTPVDPRVIIAMTDCLQYDFGNSASNHGFGLKAQQLCNNARQQVASLIQALPEEIIWTSGATEANNLAIKGIAQAYQRRGKHIITVMTEHRSVLDPCRALERQGFQVTYLQPENTGLIDHARLTAAIKPETILISIMHVNNETGVIQDLAAIGQIARSRGIFFHVDAAQSLGKLPISVRDLPIDLLAISAHKIYGPKGIGALYLRQTPPLRLYPQIHGGGHQGNLRSGTLATHQIVAMGLACQLAKQEMFAEYLRVGALRDSLWQGLKKIFTNIKLNGDLNYTSNHILNVSFKGINNSDLMSALPQLALSTGSACNTFTMESSYVLRALGHDAETAKTSIRFSLGRFTNEREIDSAIAQIKTLMSMQKSAILNREAL